MSLSRRLDLLAEQLHNLKLSAAVLRDVEEAADLVAAGEVGKPDRNHALVAMIPLPKHLANRFPAPENNKGHAPHATVCFITADQMTPGRVQDVLNCLRRLCRRQPPLRLALDVNAGLQDFGPTDSGEKALWFKLRDDPNEALSSLHHNIKRALKQAGLPCEHQPTFHGHVTWSFVPNDQSELDRQRMSSFAASRFDDTSTWFDVRQIVLSMPDGSEKPIALSPRLR